jgi:hypothetical protein
MVRALARHGGDLSSYINQMDDRMDNLMEGIKENQVLTKILAATLKVLSAFGGMSKGDIFPVNNNAIDDNNFPRYRSTYCDFSICSPYNAVIF